MTLDEAIELFIEEGRTRELSPRTLQLRRLLLGRFAHYCELHHVDDVRDVELQTILDYRRWLSHRKKAGGGPLDLGYQNRHIRLVRLLFRLLYRRTLIMGDITANLPELHEPRKLPRGIMDKDQVMKLLQQPYMTTPTGFRDRTILEVLYSTGLRGGELCRLTLYDLDLQARMIRVLGKGRKERVVPIGKVACSYLAEYLKAVRPLLLADRQSALVFLTAQGTGYNTHLLWVMIKRYRDKAHLPDNITTHSLRHTCATELLKGGASIRHVQELLGHADIATTQIYTHVVQTDLKKAHARTAPSERRQPVDVPEFDTDHPAWNDKRNAPYWSQIRRSRGEGGHEIHGTKPKPRKKGNTRKRRKK